MEKSGILTISGNISRLDDGTLLARNGVDPLQAGTDFLVNNDFRSGDHIAVTGDFESIGTGSAFFMTSVQSASDALTFAAKAAPSQGGAFEKKAAAKKASPKKTPPKNATAKSTLAKKARKGRKKTGVKRVPVKKADVKKEASPAKTKQTGKTAARGKGRK